MKKILRERMENKFDELVGMSGLSEEQLRALMVDNDLYIAGSAALWVNSGQDETWLPSDIDLFQQLYVPANVISDDEGFFDGEILYTERRGYHEYLKSIGWEKESVCPAAVTAGEEAWIEGGQFYEMYQQGHIFAASTFEVGDVKMIRVDSYRKKGAALGKSLRLQVVTQICALSGPETENYNPSIYPMSSGPEHYVRACVDRFDLDVCQCWIKYRSAHPAQVMRIPGYRAVRGSPDGDENVATRAEGGLGEGKGRSLHYALCSKMLFMISEIMWGLRRGGHLGQRRSLCIPA